MKRLRSVLPLLFLALLIGCASEGDYLQGYKDGVKQGEIADPFAPPRPPPDKSAEYKKGFLEDWKEGTRAQGELRAAPAPSGPEVKPALPRHPE